jgi:membrane associated rhomboid family serine protease
MLGAMLAIDLTIGALEPQIDGFAHVGGFIAGLALAALLAPRRNLGQAGAASV